MGFVRLTVAGAVPGSHRLPLGSFSEDSKRKELGQGENLPGRQQPCHNNMINKEKINNMKFISFYCEITCSPGRQAAATKSIYTETAEYIIRFCLYCKNMTVILRLLKK